MTGFPRRVLKRAQEGLAMDLARATAAAARGFVHGDEGGRTRTAAQAARRQWRRDGGHDSDSSSASIGSMVHQLFEADSALNVADPAAYGSRPGGIAGQQQSAHGQIATAVVVSMPPRPLAGLGVPAAPAPAFAPPAAAFAPIIAHEATAISHASPLRHVGLPAPAMPSHLHSAAAAPMASAASPAFAFAPASASPSIAHRAAAASSAGPLRRPPHPAASPAPTSVQAAAPPPAASRRTTAVSGRADHSQHAPIPAPPSPLNTTRAMVGSQPSRLRF